jgi:hypothetical protein
MPSQDPLYDAGSALVEHAGAFQRAAERQGSHLGAPAALESMQEALQLLSGAWYRLAADASPVRNHDCGAAAHTGPRDGALSREQEVRLIAAMHDVAAALARSARVCREGRSIVEPVLSRGVHADRVGAGHRDGDLSWFASSRPTIGQVP